jgi:hypothetical protein
MNPSPILLAFYLRKTLPYELPNVLTDAGLQRYEFDHSGAHASGSGYVLHNQQFYVWNAEQIFQSASLQIGERVRPFGAVNVQYDQMDVSLLGFYTAEADILVATNIADYDLRVEELADRKNQTLPWVYRFRKTDKASFSLNSRRICSRWASWRANALPEASRRFQVLESKLLTGAADDLSPD